MFLKEQQNAPRNEEKSQTGNVKDKVDDLFKSEPKVYDSKCKDVDNKFIQENQTKVTEDNNVGRKVPCRKDLRSEISSCNKIVIHQSHSSEIEKKSTTDTQADNSKTHVDNSNQYIENDDLMNYAICGSQRVEDETCNEDTDTSTKRYVIHTLLMFLYIVGIF